MAVALSAAARRRRGRASAAVAILVAALLLSSSATASAASSYPARVVTGLLSSTASAVVKQLWSLKSKSRTGSSSSAAAAGRSVVKYEGGYAVETVFDGSKLGIEPYDVEITPAGELLVLDSMSARPPPPTAGLARERCCAGGEGAAEVDGARGRAAPPVDVAGVDVQAPAPPLPASGSGERGES